MFGVAAVLDKGKQRHDVETAEHPDTEQVHQHPVAAGLLQETRNIHLAAAFQPGIGKEQIDTEYAQADGAQRHQAQFHPFAGQFFTQEGAQADTDGEGPKQQGIKAVGTQQVVIHIDLELGGVGRAQKPEPGNPEYTHPHGFHFPGITDDMPGFLPQVPVQLQRLIRRRRRGNTPGGQITQQRQAHHCHGHHAIAHTLHFQEHAGNGTQQNGQESAHFHQGITGYQFLVVQLLGNDGILDRAKEGGLQAHAEQYAKQEIHRVKEEAHGGGGHDADFHKFDLADQ